MSRPVRSYKQLKKAHMRSTMAQTRAITHAYKNFETINFKHNVSNLTFNGSKFVKSFEKDVSKNQEGDGCITYIEHSEAYGNMKAGITVVKALEVNETRKIYDLVQLTWDKIEKDAKKKEQEVEEARQEMERLSLLEQAENKEKTKTEDITIKHEELMEQIASDSNESSNICESNESCDANTEVTTEGVENSNDKSVRKKKQKPSRRQKALDRYRDEMLRQAEKKSINKICRRYLKDLRSKFSLIEIPDVKYFEIQVNSTAMIVDDVKVYSVKLPPGAKDKILIFIGDLQMKSSAARNIDPTYKTNEAVTEQYEFLERLKNQEGVKTIAMDDIEFEDVEVDDDLDDDLDMPDLEPNTAIDC